MRRVMWSIALAVLLPATVFAQAQTTGRVTGTVKDESGNPLAGAEVTALATGLALERTTTTNERGEFQFQLLPTGRYSVSVTMTGMQPQVLSFDLGIGETVPLSVSLAPGEAASESITVSGTASELETTQGGASFSYDKQINVLPVHDRTIEGVSFMAPNVSYGATPGTIMIAGAPSYDTTVVLDGAEISDPYFGSAPTVYLEDALEEVQVLTSGVSARYGRFQGGVLNAITKSGTNDFHGTLRAELENQSWNSQTPFKETQADDLQQGYQATLGGPIVRDRAWFFGGTFQAPTSSIGRTTAETQEPFATTTEEERYQAKLRLALNSSHIVEGTYLKFGDTISDRPGLVAGDLLALTTREDPREVYSLTYQGVLSANAFLDAVLSRKDVAIAEGGQHSGRDPFIEYNTVTVFNNGWWDFADPSIRDNETASAGLSWLKDTARLGDHNLEGGLQYVSSTTGGENRQSSTGYNLLAFNPDFVDVSGSEPRFNFQYGYMYRWIALPLGGDQAIDNTAVYLQDGITASNWRFDLGLRYEKYEGSGPLPQFSMKYDGLAPRVGVTYSFMPSWQVQATYGRYISRLDDNVANNETGVANAPRIETIYLGPDLRGLTYDQVQAVLHNDTYWPQVTDYVDPASGTTVLARDIDSPYADEITLSLRGALPNNTGTMTLTYTNRKYKNLIEDFQGGVCDYGLDFGRACPVGNVTVITQTQPPRLLDTTVYANDSRARRKYDAVSLVADWRPNAAFQLGGNYTYAITKANYEGEGQNTPASAGPWGNAEKAKDMAHAAPYGYSDDDIRDRANIYSTYRMDWNRAGALTLGGLLRYETGLPYSHIVQVPYRNVPEYVSSDRGTYPHYVSSKGAFRFDDVWSFDLSARYDIPVFRSFRPQIQVSARNLFNNGAVINFNTTSIAAVYSDPTHPGPDTVIGGAPLGTCGFDDEPSQSCSRYGRIRNQNDYQLPRRYLVTLGITF
jgi:carboxypeptidase family protein/TonB-dependent receptor-like protein/Big-like domain-containing protein